MIRDGGVGYLAARAQESRALYKSLPLGILGGKSKREKKGPTDKPWDSALYGQRAGERLKVSYRFILLGLAGVQAANTQAGWLLHLTQAEGP